MGAGLPLLVANSASALAGHIAPRPSSPTPLGPGLRYDGSPLVRIVIARASVFYRPRTIGLQFWILGDIYEIEHERGCVCVPSHQRKLVDFTRGPPSGGPLRISLIEQTMPICTSRQSLHVEVLLVSHTASRRWLLKFLGLAPLMALPRAGQTSPEVWYASPSAWNDALRAGLFKHFGRPHPLLLDAVVKHQNTRIIEVLPQDVVLYPLHKTLPVDGTGGRSR